MRIIQRRNEKRRQQLEGVEDYLLDAFSPVAPSQEFVSELRSQLSSIPFPAPPSPVKIGQYTFYAIALVLGGGILFAIFIRLAITLIALFSLIERNRSVEGKANT